MEHSASGLSYFNASKWDIELCQQEQYVEIRQQAEVPEQKESVIQATISGY